MRVRLTIQSYWEISIAMSRRWMRKQDAFRRDENDEDENWNKNNDDQIANEQADHTSHVTRMIYAQEIMKQDEVIKSKRDKYREFSKSWHEFLRFLSSIEDEQKFSQDETKDKRKMASFQTKIKNARMIRWKRLRKINSRYELRRIMSSNSQFRDIQKPIIQTIMQKKSFVIVMMSIEKRKNLLFMLSAVCQFEESSIVIVSLIALRQNLKRRCEKMSIRCVEWNSQKSLDAASIVLVTSKFAIRNEFRTFINRLRTTQRLNQIVIDECHVMLND